MKNSLATLAAAGLTTALTTGLTVGLTVGTASVAHAETRDPYTSVTISDPRGDLTTTGNPDLTPAETLSGDYVRVTYSVDRLNQNISVVHRVRDLNKNAGTQQFHTIVNPTAPNVASRTIIVTPFAPTDTPGVRIYLGTVDGKKRYARCDDAFLAVSDAAVGVSVPLSCLANPTKVRFRSTTHIKRTTPGYVSDTTTQTTAINTSNLR